MKIDLSYTQRHLLGVCVDRYIADIREACEQDQGTPEGEPDTVGRIVQDELRELRGLIREAAVG